MFYRVAGMFALALAIAAPSSHADGYRVEVVVPGHGLNGIHGITFDADDNLYVGSVIGQSIYQVDPVTGDAFTHIGLPEGQADDLEFAPDGTLVWTSFTHGIVRAKTGDGPIRELAKGYPGANSLAFRDDGRLFFTQVFLGDALYEIDPAGEKEPVKLLENIGGLNGFDFGPDGFLYGPLWFKGQVVKIDVDTKALEVVADGFETPCAVNFDSQGNLWVLDTKSGKIYRINIETKEKTEVTEFTPGMDNLAFNAQDRLYVTVMRNNAIYEINTESGAPREVTKSGLSVPCDIAVLRDKDRDIVYVSDIFSLRSVETFTRRVNDLAINYSDDLHNPIGIYVDDAHILVTSWFSGVLQQFDRATGESQISVEGFAAPMDAAIFGNGDWLVLEGGTGNVIRVSGEDKTTRTIVAEDLAGCVGVALASDTKAYVTCTVGGRLVEVEVETGAVNELLSGLVSPEGIAVGPEGGLVLAEVGRQRVVSFNPETGAVETLAEGLTIGLPGPDGVPQSYTPTGVAVSDDGTIYFSSDIEDALYKLTRN